LVEQGEALFTIGETAVYAPFSGLLRGLIREGMTVPRGMKVADIDPRIDVDWRTISDKARCLGGAALEAYFYLQNNYTKLRLNFVESIDK
jgi:xanthine dehydrogenase accessory factor